MSSPPNERAPTGRALGWLVAGLGAFMAGVFVLVLLLQALDPAAMDGGSWMRTVGAAVATILWCAAAGWGLLRARLGEGGAAAFASGVLRIVSGVASFGAAIAFLIYAAGLPGPGADPAAAEAVRSVPGLPAGARGALVAAGLLAMTAAGASVARWRLDRGRDPGDGIRTVRPGSEA